MCNEKGKEMGKVDGVQFTTFPLLCEIKKSLGQIVLRKASFGKNKVGNIHVPAMPY